MKLCKRGHPRTADNLYGRACKTCANERSTKWQEANPEKKRTINKRWRASHSKAWARKRRYGVTEERYQQLRKDGCWLCKQPFKEDEVVYIDHDHLTDTVRGGTHNACNVLIGLVGESAVLLRTIASSLEKYTKERSCE